MSSHLQKKCFVASTAMHLLALGALVVGSAFMTPQPRKESVALLELIPLDQLKLTDEMVMPAAAQPTPAPSPAPEPVQPQTTPPEVIKQPDPEPPKKQEPEPEPEPEPVKPKPTPKPKAQPKADVLPPKENKVEKSPDTLTRTPKTTPKADPKKSEPVKTVEKPKHTIQPDFTKVSDDKLKKEQELAAQREKQRRERIKREQEESERRQRELETQVAAANEAARRAHEARASAVRGALGSIEGGLSSGTAIEMPGPGAEAYANYGLVIQSIFMRAWQTPDEAMKPVTVRAEIKVGRDGRIISANIIGKSNDPIVDRSVRRALDRVTKLPPFPEGAKDAERTFKINFNLKPKRQIG